ncbi:carotenoid ester lipase precursor [Lactifluus volemus]|nr:carotenoid ester lipase precursor [Lactifluus volemus]
MRKFSFISTLFATALVFAGPGFCNCADAPPQAYLDNGTFIGICRNETTQFLGIPYAQPPTSHRRLRLPVPLEPYEGHYEADAFGSSCPQQRIAVPLELPLAVKAVIDRIEGNRYENVTTDSEDCLTINIITPGNATTTSQLPVVVWIYGGGFEVGGTATPSNNGEIIVSRSVEIGEPIIFVSMNYRLSALGFLGGKQVKEAKIGNLGLQDQRLALRWVQKYISAFGGDPSKVTIWGQSAGAISVALHMLVNQGNQEGLFRGAIMQSGGPIPVGDIVDGQKFYDFMVNNTACYGSHDTLECLRNVPYGRFKYAIDISPNFLSRQGLALAWLPRVDGVFLTEPPQQAVVDGRVADVPIITGNCDDEGTLFSIGSLDVTTTAQLNKYLRSFMIPTASESEIDMLLQYYPDDPSAGSPFDTGSRNAITPEFKRIAAIQGDAVFHGPRRLMLKHLACDQASWAYVYKRGKDTTPFFGAVHGSDVSNAFGDGELRDYIIYFTRNLDPNNHLRVPWPQWHSQNPQALIFQDNKTEPLIQEKDNYRPDALEYLTNLSLLHPI